eukprot:scaffold23471_cov141-Cylindrotheca_fusiformis.AAC.15
MASGRCNCHLDLHLHLPLLFDKSSFPLRYLRMLHLWSVVLFLYVATTITDGFVPPCRHRNRHALCASSAGITTLTEDTTWNMRFFLQGLPTQKGKRINEMLFTVEAQFIEEEGYEPPQGNLRVAMTDSEGDAGKLTIVKSRWILSEDPNERKDGLWVWGLFSEPLYPYLLLQLETGPIALAGDDGDAIKPLKLFCQLIHKREKKVGVILKGSDLKVREMETVKAVSFVVVRTQQEEGCA